MAFSVTEKTRLEVREIKTEIMRISDSVEITRTSTYLCESDSKNFQRKGTKPENVEEKVNYKGKPSKDRYFGEFFVVKPELLKKLHYEGWFKSVQDQDLIQKKPFSFIEDGEKYEIIRIKQYDHTIYDIDGKPLPVAIHFEYIGGQVNNEQFELKTLLEHLQTREDVTILKSQYYGELIRPIPDYNVTEGKTHYFEFIWHPTVEVYREFRKRVGNGDHFKRYEVAHMMLGNDKFRI